MSLRELTTRLARATIAVVAVWAVGAAVLPATDSGVARAAVTQPNSADRMIFWTGCNDLATMSDAELNSWKSRGVGGFACGVGWLRGMGGTQDFSGDPNASLAGSNYDLQRSLRDSRIGDRLRARGMKAYLGTYLGNYWNKATPLREWFDDDGWSQLVLPKLGDLAGAAKQLGFAGLAFDQELYGQEGGVHTAHWGWNYQGNNRSEQQTRAQAKKRGQQLMQHLVSKLPGIELLAYDVEFPETWGELVQQKVNGFQNVYGTRLDIDFWDGLSSVEGYGALRLADAYFYKIPHMGTWDTAFQYHFNKLYAYLSRRMSNWKYASSRFHVSPFAWIDTGPSHAFEAAKPPPYVASQLQAFRKWGMGGEFANYAYAPLRSFDYTPYASAMQAAGQPAVVDPQPPTLTVNGPPAGSQQAAASLALDGTAGDNLALRSVRWENDRGDSGMASLTWEPLSGNYDTGYTWRTRWSIPALALQPGTNKITVTATDIKDVETSRTFTYQNGGAATPPTNPPPTNPPPTNPPPTNPQPTNPPPANPPINRPPPIQRPPAAQMPRPGVGKKGETPRARHDKAAARLAVSARPVRVGHGRRFRLRVRCLGPERCDGTLRLYGRGWVKIAVARFEIDPGKSKLVRVRLSRAGARRLQRSGKLKGMAIARARGGAGNLGQAWTPATLLSPRR